MIFIVAPDDNAIRLSFAEATEMVNLYVGITDYDWFRFLAAQPGVDEVNFWQPGGRTNFQALRSGELFLFKLHSPRNFIVGGGFYVRSDILPASLVWEAFGTKNGTPSFPEMRKRIAFYRGRPDDPREDYRIGCRVLAQPFFFPEDQWIPIPASFSLHIQQGRRYSSEEEDGRALWEAVMVHSQPYPLQFHGMGSRRWYAHVSDKVPSG